MKAMILAAGQGMHLRLLTEHMPKCMISAGGKPVLEHTFEYHHIRGPGRFFVVKRKPSCK
jgi:NDP-sugar pyrophosphorylase family protein